MFISSIVFKKWRGGGRGAFDTTSPVQGRPKKPNLNRVNLRVMKEVKTATLSNGREKLLRLMEIETFNGKKHKINSNAKEQKIKHLTLRNEMKVKTFVAGTETAENVFVQLHRESIHLTLSGRRGGGGRKVLALISTFKNSSVI